MPARFVQSATSSTSTAGYFALADEDDRPVGERIPGHIVLSLKGGQFTSGFTASRPVTFTLPPEGLRRPWRQSRTKLRRVPVVGVWVHVPRLHRRWIKPDRAGRVGFYSTEDVLLWFTAWVSVPELADTLGVTSVEIEADDD
jgi:hypothetical protein